MRREPTLLIPVAARPGRATTGSTVRLHERLRGSAQTDAPPQARATAAERQLTIARSFTASDSLRTRGASHDAPASPAS